MTMITPSYLGETIEYSSLHACRSTLEDPTPGLPDPIPGTVTVVSPALDPNSTTVEVWLEAKNPKHMLKPGSSVQLSITASTVKDALVVPANSVITAQDGAPAVMLAGADGRAHQKAVKLGVRNGDDVQITDGVAKGDKVIATGAYGLPDKTKIKIEAAETPTEGKDAQDSKNDKKDDKAGAKPAAGGSDEK